MAAIAFEAMSRRTLGAFKQHARRAGLSLDEYLGRRASGEKRCSSCGKWKTEDRFPSDAANSDGLYASCRDCSARANREQRQKRRFPAKALEARLAASVKRRSEVARDTKRVARQAATRQRNHDRDPDVKTYRVARRSHQTDFERVLADAQGEYLAYLATQEKTVRGGRPRRSA